MGVISSTDAASETHVIASDAEALEVAAEVAAFLAPGASRRDREGDAGDAELEVLGRSGLLGITVPREHGGAGASAATLTEVVRILSAVDPAIAQVPQNHYVTILLLHEYGTPEQQRFFFDEVVRRGARFGSAVSERGTAHASSMQTRLVRQPDGSYRLDGTKYYTTGSLNGQWIRVGAIDDEGRVLFAFVRREDEGVEVVNDWSAMGQRGTASGTTVLDGVHVPADRVVPHWRVFGRPHVLGAYLHIIHAAIEVGIARGAFDDGIAFVNERARPWGEAVAAGWATLGEEPHIVLQIGRMATRLHAAEALLARAATIVDEAMSAPVTDVSASRASVAVAEAKAYGTEIAVELASEIFSLAGASAADDRLNLHRHWRNARTHSLHDPVRWKYIRAGEFALHGTIAIDHGAL